MTAATDAKWKAGLDVGPMAVTASLEVAQAFRSDPDALIMRGLRGYPGFRQDQPRGASIVQAANGYAPAWIFCAAQARGTRKVRPETLPQTATALWLFADPFYGPLR